MNNTGVAKEETKKEEIQKMVKNRNTGYRNTGSCNTGSCNTGHWNTGDWNTGYFNTVTPDYILIFNKECKREDWENAIKPSFLYFDLTKWVSGDKMTNKEKEEHKEWETTGGYLKQMEYKEAFQKSFSNLSEEERRIQIEQLKALPNFDRKIFYEISGIDIEEPVVKEMTIAEISDKLGYEVKAVKEHE